MQTFVGNRKARAYITVAVTGWGKIIGFKISKERNAGLNELMLEMRSYVSDNTTFYCDGAGSYIRPIDRRFSNADYVSEASGDSAEYLASLGILTEHLRDFSQI